MADIRIEKEETSTPIWPWLLGLLLLGLVIWGVAEAFDDDDDVDLVDNTEMVDDAVVVDRGSEIVSSGNTYSLIDFDDASAGSRFGEYADAYNVYTDNLTGEMGLDHEFSHNALIQLANASVALAQAHGMGADMNVKQKAQMIKDKANAITMDPMATTHADDIRAAAMSISDILGQVQSMHYADLSGSMMEVKKNAADINAKTLTLNQKEDVRTFFGSANVLLKAMRQQQG